MLAEPKRWKALFAALVLVAFVVFRSSDLLKPCVADESEGLFNDLVYAATCWRSTSSWTGEIVVFFLKVMGCGFGDLEWLYWRKVRGASERSMYLVHFLDSQGLQLQFIYCGNAVQNVPEGWYQGFANFHMVSDPQAFTTQP